MEQCQPSINIVSLNIEGQKHLKDRVTPFLVRQNPEVVLLQEVFDHDLRFLSSRLNMEVIFAPMRRKSLKSGDKQTYDWGLAILSRLPVVECEALYYDKSAHNLPDTPLDGINDDNAKAVLGVVVEKRGKRFNLATTHFTWTPDGKPSAQQWETLEGLMQVIRGKKMVLTGDKNAPRGGPIWAEICTEFTDNIPVDVNTTIDGNLHRVGPLPHVVDGLFTSGYEARNVWVKDGVSDHYAVIGDIFSIE